MTMQPDLFTPRRYPQAPGVKSSDDTTRKAAAKTAPGLNAMRARVLAMLAREPMTADECAAAMGFKPGQVRPRFSELRAMGRIIDAGERRDNADGNPMIVWGLA